MSSSDEIYRSRVRGIYCWTDCGYRCQWRLQVHYRGSQYRLLAPNGRVVCVGDEATCRQRLEQAIDEHDLQRTTRRLVVLLHGLARNAWTMAPLARYLRKQWPGTDVVAFQYASTTAPVVDHAQRFVQFMEMACEANEVHFVGHSLGNIVLRRAFRLAEEGRWQLPKLGRHVMLGPPNQGSQIAHRLRTFVPVAWFTGRPFLQLGRDWADFLPELATPPCPFGVIAGRIHWIDRWHPLLEGPSDVIVRVEETHLAGESDFLEVFVPHAWLMNSRRVQRATMSFLQHGSFATG